MNIQLLKVSELDLITGGIMRRLKYKSVIPRGSGTRLQWNGHLQSDVGGQHCLCPVLVSFLSGFSGKSWPVSICCPDFLSGVCLSGLCLSQFSPLSGFCPDYRKKLPVVCPAGQGRDRAVRTFTVLVRRRLVTVHNLLPLILIRLGFRRL